MQVNLNSTCLELHLFAKCMNILLDKLDGIVSEVCTDAHSSIIKVMSKYKSFSKMLMDNATLGEYMEATIVTQKLTTPYFNMQEVLSGK